MSEEKIKNLIEWFNTQSLGVYLPLAIFLISFLTRTFSVLFADSTLNVEGLFTVVWSSYSHIEQTAIIVQFIMIAALIALWFVSRSHARKVELKKEEQYKKDVQSIAEIIEKSYNDYNSIIAKYYELSSIDENVVKCLIEPLKDTHINAIKNNVDLSVNKLKSYVAIANDSEDSILNEKINEFDKGKTRTEILEDIENGKFIVDEKVKMVGIVFDLVSGAVSSMNELTAEVREAKRKKAEIDGCFYITNGSNSSMIMRIWYDEAVYDYKAILYSSSEERKYDVFVVDSDENNEKANVIVYCNENNSVDLLSFDVDISTHGRIYSCRYIKDDRISIDGFCIKKLDEKFLGFKKPLLSTYVSKETFSEIDKKAKKEVKIPPELKGICTEK